ncbi:aldehyde dehydrogenase [Kocuria dechangensis]|uniref:Aldehyde dehydrogenase n=1 Tax=Kocuria dechangensis TaxID=1176249 RepID=A0A917GXB0_9MICC|nr:aldehyde dehydrogenase family protein [Kocuria dechangensis]GGG60516.1 aldehyde dehydrogenase [Kocuria dechangensis]
MTSSTTLTGTYPMTINGQAISSTDSFGVINPATGAEFARAPQCTPQQLEEAVRAAEAALPAWGADEQQRITALRRLADVLDEHVQEIAAVLTDEQGKPLGAAAYEVSETARWLRASAELPLPEETVEAGPDVSVRVVRRPLGVVAAITPWNFPLLLLGWKVGPALRAGNTVVVKPSPYTPLSTLLVGELAQQVLPPGVVSVVSGGDELGARLSTHPGIAKISFTGSVATGKKVAAAAAEDLKRFTLELGGNDAAIILEDAEPEQILKGVFWGGFINCGQICAGIKRVYVPRSRHDEIAHLLAERARVVRMGPGTAERTQLGPLQNKAQFDRVAELVEEALAAGATAVAGGAPWDGEGYFFEPTVLTNVHEGMRIVDEEQFGPVMPIMAYDTVDEAVARANDSTFGLSGSVWGADIGRAQEVAQRLHTGTAFVNDHLALSPDIPFGGAKWSGIGVENGHWGLEEFTRIQVLHTPTRS